MISLQDINQAAAAAQRAEGELKSLVVAAMSQTGADVTAIAGAAGISRSTCYRWQAEAEAEHSTGEVPADVRGETLDHALRALQSVGSGPAYMIAAGLRTGDLTAKARRVLHLAGQVPTPLPERERGEIAAGVILAHKILSIPPGAAESARLDTTHHPTTRGGTP